MTASSGEQLALVPPTPSRQRPAGENAAPEVADPVADVVIDTPLAHLDRVFEYAVPAALDETAVPGVRVRVRFAGRDHDGFLLERRANAQHVGTLTPLRRVVSPEPVLTPHIHRVARRVADHYAGTLADVLRLAVPPRHARAERSTPEAAPASEEPAPEPERIHSPWQPYPAGEALLRRLADGEGPWASVLALPGSAPRPRWAAEVGALVAAASSAGRGSVVVVPDHRDVERLGAALDALLGVGRHVKLTADQGPEARYRSWLSVLRGQQRVVIGTRAAAYAPVHEPGLFVLWDDGDDLHREPRSPYPHTREVLRLRAEDAGAGLVVSGYVRTAEVGWWVRGERMHSVHAPGDVVRAAGPRVEVAGEGYEPSRDAAAQSARLPSLAWRAVSEGLQRGPVLVQVPRRGYVMGLSCLQCRTRVRCPSCHGPTEVAGHQRGARCRWCDTDVTAVPCPACGSTRRRADNAGDERTAYEIGRAFAQVPVMTSRSGHVLDTVDARPAIVVATPGAEPAAAEGYAAVLLLDGWALLGRAGLDAPVESLRRWSAAAGLARPAEDGGRVVLCGVPAHAGLRPIEALVRWDPQWLVDSELHEREEIGLPPVSRAAVITGDAAAVREVERHLHDHLDPALVGASGPAPAGEDGLRLVLRTLSAHGEAAAGSRELRRLVRGERAHRSATKAPGQVSMVVDPADLAP